MQDTTKVKRVISIFNRSNEELISEVDINYVPLEKLKEIFIGKSDDPLLYDPYQINEEEGRSLSKYLRIDLIFDFLKFIYQLDCYKDE